MWEPDPSWRRLPGAGGPSTVGIWLAEVDGRRWVVKRLAAPEQPAGALADPAYAGYWRREAEVARDPAVVDGPGLVPPEFGPVEEDEDGITVWSLEQEGEPPPGLFVARALGRFAGAAHARPAVGLPPAAGRPAGDGGGARRLADARPYDAGRRRRRALADGVSTGWADARRHRRVGCTATRSRPTSWLRVPMTWWRWTGSASGSGRSAPTSATTHCPAVRSSRSWSSAFLDGVSDGGSGLDAIRRRSRWLHGSPPSTPCSPARSGRSRRRPAARARWPGKFRHPAVAPYLRAVQRQFPQIEWLVQARH